MNSQDWTLIRTRTRRLLDIYRHKMDPSAIEAVEHYIAHDEYEMAVEGMCLELMKLAEFSFEDRSDCRELAVMLRLDSESVFDADFWKRLSTS